MSTNTAPRHPALELLGRYRAVAQAAWQARHELAGPKRLADEAAFLPAALSLQETPVHPAPRRAMWVIMTLFVVALAWACLGKVDIVAVAQGRIVVSDRTKVVQPLEAAVVKAVHVRDGDKVEAGQLLVELDATAATADRQSVEQLTQAASDELWRTQALLAALKSGRAPAGAPRAPLQVQTSAEWADIAGRAARMDAEVARRQAELATVESGIAKLQATLPLARQREADLQALAAQGFVSGHAGQDRTRERIELERDLETQRARRAESLAAVQESVQARAALRAETERALNDRLAKATLEIAQLRQEEAKTVQRKQLTQLVAPVAGTVQQLAVHTEGGVVTPAQALMVIVPDDAEVTAEVVIENKDVGFLRVGQAVEVKLETFPFTRYGTVPALVKRVSVDAVNDEQRGAIFPATLSLLRGSIDVDGRLLALTPGMNVTGEVKTGRRRLIDYVVSPIKATADKSLEER
jgi:hemolysin D